MQRLLERAAFLLALAPCRATAAANAASSASDQGRRLMVGSSICIHLSRHPYGVRRGTPTATEDQKPQWWSPAGTTKGTAAAPVAPGGTGRGSARARTALTNVRSSAGAHFSPVATPDAGR